MRMAVVVTRAARTLSTSRQRPIRDVAPIEPTSPSVNERIEGVSSKTIDKPSLGRISTVPAALLRRGGRDRRSFGLMEMLDQRQL